MSNDHSSSFTSNNGFDRSFNTSYGSSQNTQATEVSEFSNSGVAARQFRNIAAEEALVQNVGYGVGQFGVATTPFGNSYGFSAANSTTTSYIQRSEEQSVYEAPWSGLPLLHQFDPYPAIQRPSASRPGQLEYPVYTVYDIPSSAVPSMPLGSNSWARQQGTGMVPFGTTENFAVTHQYTSRSFDQGDKVPIAKLPASTRSIDTTSEDAEPKPRYWCKVPGCIASCGRSDDLDRHVRNCHDEAEIGPYWLCHVCRHWEYNGRQDKMREHYRIKHNHVLAKGECPYHSVQSVGRQNHVARVSTNGKLTRRRKRRLT